MLHFRKIPKNVGQNLEKFGRILIKFADLVKNQQNFQQFLTKKLRLENGSKTVQRSALCWSRRELSNEYLLAKFGFDTAVHEPCKVCPLSAYRSPRSMMSRPKVQLTLRARLPRVRRTRNWTWGPCGRTSWWARYRMRTRSRRSSRYKDTNE